MTQGIVEGSEFCSRVPFHELRRVPASPAPKLGHIRRRDPAEVRYAPVGELRVSAAVHAVHHQLSENAFGLPGLREKRFQKSHVTFSRRAGPYPIAAGSKDRTMPFGIQFLYAGYIGGPHFRI